MAEALSDEVRWREPTFLDSTLSVEEDTDFTEHFKSERWNLPFHRWPLHWEPIRPRHEVTYIDDEAIAVFVSSEACSEIWNSLSVFVHKTEPSWGQLFECLWNVWDVPTLNTRSDEESENSVEAQLKRLERCSGTETANLIRTELEQQIEDSEEEDATIPIAALRRLVDFICAHPRIKHPFVFIGAETIKAQWQPSSEQIAWIEFDPTENARLLAFCPDPKAAGGIRRFVGNSTVKSAYRDLLGFGATWITR